MDGEKQFYRPDEVAELLRVSVRTVRRWVAGGKIEHVRTPGKEIRIPNREVLRFMEIGENGE